MTVPASSAQHLLPSIHQQLTSLARQVVHPTVQTQLNLLCQAASRACPSPYLGGREATPSMMQECAIIISGFRTSISPRSPGWSNPQGGAWASG